MKRPVLSFLCLLIYLIGTSQVLPKFSNNDTDYWYYIEFAVNSSVIQDIGPNQELRNRVAAEDEDGQLWKLTGNESACILTSKTGRQLFYSQQNNRFIASQTDGTAMKFVATSNGKWELHLVDSSLAPAANPDALAIVINNGSGIDRYLDVWKHDFNACALNFIRMEDKTFSIQAPPAEAEEVNISGSSTEPEQPLTLWYNSPAKNWTREALPIGNGDMGAMIFGGIAQDRIQFNHKTLWKGSSSATDLGSYLAFGDLYIINKNTQAAENYKRELDLTEANVKVTYTQGNSDFERDYFCSFPHQVIAIRYKATGTDKLNLDLQFINAQGNKAKYSPDGASFNGALENGMNYRATMVVQTSGGSKTANNTAISVNDADEVTIYIACATDFDASYPNHLHGDTEALSSKLTQTVQTAQAQGFDNVMTAHVADYAELFNRVKFTIEGYHNIVPTNRLLQRNITASKLMVDMLIFHYGRYLTIASSRGVSLPSNLQGIWNKDGNAQSSAVWASDIHANINVQMNYWPAEPTNLSECHLPFLNYIKNEALRQDGQWQQNARDLGVDKGWVVNTAGNIFGGSSSYKLGKYSVANAWFCTHLWQHYAYTCDTDFLRETAMPVMKSACEFWFERLVPAQNNDGTLECPYEYSPEQGRIQNATAHAQQLVTMLFEQTLEAIDVLGKDASQCDDAFISTLRDKLSKLDKGLRIDENGMLREWKYQENTPNLSADTDYFANDEENVWQGHRHTSHLMALYPGFNIDKGIDPDIFDAAVKSLDDRGDVATGWARAWRISLWARTRDAKRAYKTLRGFAHRTTSLDYDWHGGLYDNMLDAHATSVFQIEGNFGATAGIAEMLLQSRPDSVILLPALPEEWANGNISGLKALGNFEFDLVWKNGKLISATIQSLSGNPLTIAYPNIAEAKISVENGNADNVDKTNTDRISLSTEKGAKYILDMSEINSSISGTVIPEPEITVINNHLVIKGIDNTDVTAYDINGRPIDTTERVDSGVYIVKTPNQVKKIIVK